MSEETLLKSEPVEEQNGAEIKIEDTPVEEKVSESGEFAVPEKYKDAKWAKNIGSTEDMFNQMENLQRMLGGEKIALPKDDADVEQWDKIYEVMGRPDKVDGYKMPEVELPEGLEVKPEEFDGFSKVAHELGLGQKQYEGILKHYIDTQKDSYQTSAEQIAAESAESQRALQAEWGDSMGSRINQATALVKQMGSDELLSKISQSGLGRDAEFIKLMATVSDAFMEDNPRSEGRSLVLTGTDKAKSEIQKKKDDPGFMKRYMNSDEAGHKAAVEEMQRLYKIATHEK